MISQLKNFFEEKAIPRLTSSLGTFFGFPVRVVLKTFKTVDLKEVMHLFEDPEERHAVVILKINGSIPGYLVAVFPIDSAKMLASKLTGSHTNGEDLTEFEESALKETTNIFAGTFLTVISDALNQNMIAGVPVMTVDMVLAAMDIVLIDMAKLTDATELLELEFSGEGVKGYCFYLLDQSAYAELEKVFLKRFE